jgi:3',5'-cyclic AMP phosphodiesterase CpdA
MIIAQISDTHLDPEDQDVSSRIQDLERCVSDINGLESLPDIVIHTGDMAHNGTASKYKEAVRILKRLNCTLYISAGNRDDRAEILTHFPQERYLLPDTPFVQYSIEGYEVRLIALDTLSESTNMGSFCKMRADSLRTTLAEEPLKPTAIFMHHPPFEIKASKHPWQYDNQESIDLLSNALDGQKQVVRAFCGHSHRNASGFISEVPASCVPSVAIDVRLGSFPNSAKTKPVYQLHTYKSRQGFFTETRAAN